MPLVSSFLNQIRMLLFPVFFLMLLLVFLHFNSSGGRHFYSAFRSDGLRKKKRNEKQNLENPILKILVDIYCPVFLLLRVLFSSRL